MFELWRIGQKWGPSARSSGPSSVLFLTRRRAELPKIQAAEATAELVKKSAACQAHFAPMRKEALFHHFKELL